MPFIGYHEDQTRVRGSPQRGRYDPAGHWFPSAYYMPSGTPLSDLAVAAGHGVTPAPQQTPSGATLVSDTRPMGNAPPQAFGDVLDPTGQSSSSLAEDAWFWLKTFGHPHGPSATPEQLDQYLRSSNPPAAAPIGYGQPAPGTTDWPPPNALDYVPHDSRTDPNGPRDLNLPPQGVRGWNPWTNPNPVMPNTDVRTALATPAGGGSGAPVGSPGDILRMRLQGGPGTGYG